MASVHSSKKTDPYTKDLLTKAKNMVTEDLLIKTAMYGQASGSMMYKVATQNSEELMD